ncbi:putative nucleoside phosphatase, putative,guanosine diphosphatase [Trypanosoma rangeli]|uniref:Putative nucleoside phosphatase, putative,guanosine diphosphatase n=1 Tax=Trypanosoma rangeli TaxID=5698 RepID=A0A3R7NV38_TRYRA|nr:putative nucleoside phosphatase, putative,guanosine diphosphatase [Trypanosoma rangeli]RNF08193.1 putative nucleoside phosphatase, putative,guanosine diphosphatase [Trypanosoma rangeli]|eukprot:RNF08193.1 putative nucleoside phosphatase, putative,guanosine diphosphatase [Trypanosoma rangeli]
MKAFLARNRGTQRPCLGLTFALLCAFVVAAVYLTAYGVGRMSVVTRGQEKLELTARIVSSMTERLLHCEAQRQQLRSGQATARMALEIARDTQANLETELELFRSRNTLSLQSVEECKKELASLKEKGVGVLLSAQILNRLAEERQLYLNTLAVVNASSEVGRSQTADLWAATAKEVRRWEAAVHSNMKLLQTCNDATQRYSIVFDAGSTGSRVHVFRYRLISKPHADKFTGHVKRHSLLPFLRLEDELFVENHEPLSGFDNATSAAVSLLPLLDAAKSYIPPSLHACAPLELKATAGLRRVGRERAQAVLHAVRRVFERGPFWIQSELNSVRILEGREEGPLAWLTVNYLIGTLHGDAKTATIVDLGGGSTQIVMHSNDTDGLDASAEFSHVFNVSGRSIVVYQHSYEGNGLHAAKEQLLQAVAASVTGKGLAAQELNTSNSTGIDNGLNVSDDVVRDAFPCFPKGYVHMESGISNTRDGGQVPSMQACSALFRRHVVRKHQPCGGASCGFNGVFQPNISVALTGPVYVFSFYYDCLKPYIKGEVILVQDVLQIATHVCRSMKVVQEFHATKDTAKGGGLRKPEMECFELSYLFTLLHDGFGFPLEQRLHIAKKINGFEVSWALGASLATLEGQSA